MNIVIFGPPGSGKGTHSIKLVERYNLMHLSTGDIFRNQIQNQTDLGKRAKAYMELGQLVPDELVIDMLFSEMLLHKNAKGFVFDGFPRTIVQAEKFDEMLQEKGMPVKLVISLEVTEEELITRLVKRGIESGRVDDSEEVIVKRLEVYKEQTSPLLDYYSRKNIVKHIHGIGSVEEIFNAICRQIDESLN